MQERKVIIRGTVVEEEYSTWTTVEILHKPGTREAFCIRVALPVACVEAVHERSPGQRAYEAWSENRGYTAWDALSGESRARWTRIAKAARES